VALSDDQKAMLRLLAQREQGYDDLASLMGLSVDEVRARVKEALEELDKEEAVAPPPPPPEPQKVEPSTSPRAPEPEKPATPPRVTAPRPAPSANRQPRKPLPKPSLPTDGRMRVAAGAAGALAVVLIFLLIAGVFGGSDGGDSSEPSASGDTTGSTTAAAASDQITQAMLSPVDGGDASGQAVFGRIRNTAVLQVEAEGLEPSPPGQLYTVWLYRSPRIALRVGAVRVTEGRIGAQFPVPTDLLGYIAGGGFNQIDISLTPTAAYRAEVAQAKQEQRLPAYTGTSVLRGEITGRLVEAGKAAGN
jgi:hypothetical protein